MIKNGLSSSSKNCIKIDSAKMLLQIIIPKMIIMEMIDVTEKTQRLTEKRESAKERRDSERKDF